MKKILSLLILLSAAVLLAGCSKDPKPIDVATVTLDITKHSLKPGETVQLKATVLPEDADDKTVQWKSGDTLIATVDDNGLVTALIPGETTITAESGGKSATCAITVKLETSITLDITEHSMAPGRTVQLTATVLPEDADDKTVEWKSGDTLIATVDDNGLVTAVALGQATITAEAGGKSATCAVTVEFPVEAVLVTAGTFQMGSPEDEPGRNGDETQHSVTLTRNFYMSKYEITNTQFVEFLNAKHAEGVLEYGVAGNFDNAAYFTGTTDEPLVRNCSVNDLTQWGVVRNSDGTWAPAEGKANHPAIFVTWYGAKAYAEWIGGTLPTEAQWEYACRGDKGTLPYGIDTGRKLTGDMANFYTPYPYDLDHPDSPGGYSDPAADETYVPETVAVGSYPYANSYGLYDMHGNVFEWCLDKYGEYPSSSVTDPLNTEGTKHSVRGGDWDAGGVGCRASYRDLSNPDGAWNNVGFRVIFYI